MAELPERKVLKDVLSGLKTKTLCSQHRVETATKNLIGYMNKAEKLSQKYKKIQVNEECENTANEFDSTVNSLTHWMRDLIDNYCNAQEDTTLYVESLEKYSIELDKTLYDAFDQGKRKAEEHIKEQDKLLDKKCDEYIK